ncbi:MAG: hypothetical protein ACLSVG_03410 [Clostridia bacterium]
MKYSVTTFGSRQLEGEYKKVRSAGDLQIANSKVRSLLCAGDIDIRDAVIDKIRNAGDLHASNLTFGNCKTAGSITLRGICRGDTIVCIGGMDAEFLECRCIRYGTEPKRVRRSDPKSWDWSGMFKAETFEIQLPVILSMDFDFQNIIARSEITAEKEIQCSAFYALNGVTAPSINADRIFLLAKGNLCVGEVLGSDIVIDSVFKPDQAFNACPKTLRYHKITENNNSIVRAETISGDSVRIKYTKAQSVSGADVEIGDFCVIDEVIYKNTIRLSKKAVVGKVVKQ